MGATLLRGRPIAGRHSSVVLPTTGGGGGKIVSPWKYKTVVYNGDSFTPYASGDVVKNVYLTAAGVQINTKTVSQVVADNPIGAWFTFDSIYLPEWRIVVTYEPTTMGICAFTLMQRANKTPFLTYRNPTGYGTYVYGYFGPNATPQCPYGSYTSPVEAGILPTSYQNWALYQISTGSVAVSTDGSPPGGADARTAQKACSLFHVYSRRSAVPAQTLQGFVVGRAASNAAANYYAALGNTFASPAAAPGFSWASGPPSWSGGIPITWPDPRVANEVYQAVLIPASPSIATQNMIVVQDAYGCCVHAIGECDQRMASGSSTDSNACKIAAGNLGRPMINNGTVWVDATATDVYCSSCYNTFEAPSAGTEVQTSTPSSWAAQYGNHMRTCVGANRS